jgi:two-component system chemotaxis sensor kinase CheA
MPISSASYQALDDCVNRLATESILASPGRDEGLIPAFSLLGELCELCNAEPLVLGPVSARRADLEKRLDAAQPFDAPTLEQLRLLISWLPGALAAIKGGDVPAPLGAPVPAATSDVAMPAGSTDADERKDVLLELNLGENQELLREFYAEAVDHLQQIEAALLILDQQPDQSDALNSIFRSFHTIKGNAGFLGLVPMQSLAHEVESLLDLARNHELRLTSAIITEILRSRDTLQAQIQQVGVALESGQAPTEIVPVSHLIKAVKLLVRQSLAPAAEAPPVPEAPAGQEVDPVGPSPSPVAVAAGPAENPGAARVSAEPAPLAGGKPMEKSAAKSAAGSTVRVNTDKLDNLMDVVGELVIVQSQLIESARIINDSSSPLQRNIAQLTRIAKDLQHTAMALRMIPIKQTFQKMERLARDLAQSFGKKVHFQVAGEDTELDRTVVEEIADPLVHMVRNALDHGLDTTAERLAAGKSEAGEVRLSAYHQGSNLVIELSDDGRGIDTERIFQKAVEKGVVAANTVLTRDEILALIFAPGFSTAEKVTAVSGRGVGMDVVKRNIQKLRGKIEIISELGKGSTFKIKLPLTLAIIDGLVVRVGKDKFILPSTSVQLALKPAREAITTVHGIGEALELRGRIMPLHRLHRRFGIPGDAQQPWDGIVVIVEHSGKVSALLVDEMLSKQEVVIKNLGAFMQGLPGVTGGAILGDGNIALIIDPGTLLQAA